MLRISDTITKIIPNLGELISAELILHLDLKSPNILVDDKWRVKIADFGLSRVRRNTLLSGRSNIHGTFEWMAPEMLRAENFDENADVYSYGVVLWELLSAPLTPWNELINVQVVAVVGYDRQRLVLGLAAQEAAREDAATRAIGELFWACAVNDPKSRPTFQSVTERLEAALTLMLPGPDGGTGGGADLRGRDRTALRRRVCVCYQ